MREADTVTIQKIKSSRHHVNCALIASSWPVLTGSPEMPVCPLSPIWPLAPLAPWTQHCFFRHTNYNNGKTSNHPLHPLLSISLTDVHSPVFLGYHVLLVGLPPHLCPESVHVMKMRTTCSLHNDQASEMATRLSWSNQKPDTVWLQKLHC